MNGTSVGNHCQLLQCGFFSDTLQKYLDFLTETIYVTFYGWS